MVLEKRKKRKRRFNPKFFYAACWVERGRWLGPKIVERRMGIDKNS
jgi:hypothetical protein